MTKATDFEYLGPVDTAFLHAESASSPMNIGGVAVYDGLMSFEALIEHVEARIHQIPTYLRRLIVPPLNLGQPRWMPDPDFDVRSHVFKVRLDAPGSDEQLRQMAGRLVSSCLDRGKPLWEIYLIEGLRDERTGLLFKVHHAMVDGIAAIELFTVLLDLTPDYTSHPSKPLHLPPPLPDGSQLLWEALSFDLNYKVDMLNKLGSQLGFLGWVIADREKRRHLFFGAASLMSDVLSPIKALAVNGRNTGSQELAWVEFPLPEVQAVRAKAGASVNDVMLAILARALDEYETVYHGRLGRSKKSVRVLIPVNMRSEVEQHDTHNRISVLPIDIPLGIDDPLALLRIVGEHTKVMKQSYLANGLDMILTLPSLYPAVTQPLVWSFAPTIFAAVAHTWCTNVAGPQLPVYMMGHEMLHSYGFFPLNPSMGVASVVMSYNGHISMTLVTDRGIVEDARLLRGYLQTAFEDLRAAAGVPPLEVVKPVSLPTPASMPERTPVREPEPIAEPVAVPEVAMQPQPAAPLVTSNGSGKVEAAEIAAAAEVATVLEAVPVAVTTAVASETTTPTKTSYRLFSEGWADAFREAINSNVHYRRASTHWRAGALAFVMRASPRHGFSTGSAVWIDLDRGVCLATESLPAAQAAQRAAFVIEGDYPAWMRVLKNEIAPLAALARGDLRLTKGSMIKLLPFTQSAQELVHSAQHVPLSN
jgi:WS/DGAT/MGAT family acyltransferase